MSLKPKILDAEAIAKKYGISTRTFQNKYRKKLTPTIIVGRSKYFLLEDVERVHNELDPLKNFEIIKNQN